MADTSKNDDTNNKRPVTNEDLTLKNVILLSLPIVISSIIMVYIIYNDYAENRYSFFAKSRYYSYLPSSDLDLKLNVSCSKDYERDIASLKSSKSCIPTQCGRYATDFIIKPEEATKLLKIAKKAFKFGRSNGAVSTFDLQSGSITKDKTFENAFEKAKLSNDAIYTDDEINLYFEIRNRIRETIKSTFSIDKLYATKPTYYSELTSKPSFTQNDQHWIDHSDKQTYNSHDYTAIIYLNSHNIDFFGGAFTFEDHHSKISIEPKTGRVIFFTSGSENLHRVEKLQWGSSYFLTIPFTCNQVNSIDDKFSKN